VSDLSLVTAAPDSYNGYQTKETLMEGGILNEPVRESAEKLLENFGAQMGIPFDSLMFIAVAEDGTFRTGNFSQENKLTVEAIKMIAKHLNDWADSYGVDE